MSTKTVFVIYSDFPVKNTVGKKQYPFFTTNNLKIGDRVRSPAYTTDMQVTAVLAKVYKYVNKATGELSNTLTSTEQLPIRELRITTGSTNLKAYNVVKAHKVYSHRVDLDDADIDLENEFTPHF
jgi:leucyl aminopeptidase (aminopeptidase T)